jgi:hypothetical protein
VEVLAEFFVFQFSKNNVKIKRHRTIIFSVVFYGCENWPLTWEEKHRLRVFENRVLRKIFGPKEGRGKRGVEKTTQ